jgi:DNA invertase Pin-like site-specific DNA recombinase
MAVTMAASMTKPVRCAIYTRKSTEHGLELEFNSLDAQRDACEAYIKSQASQGWRGLPQHYDDPAYSGGNLDRPALQQLLKDIDAGRIDVIVVYKIDRLTRSLADFAKLVVAFDAKAISFVAVTQQFNTTTSMGRLTLNVLLSFAQFERELSSERVRDKVAASRRKGKWTGGTVPLGYDAKDKKLVINKAEAETVRYIFRRYLELQSFGKLVEDLDDKGIVTKRRNTKVKKFNGAIPFTYGPLAYFFKNRIYVGETGHKEKWFPGEHAAIVDRKIFDQVQQLLASQPAGRKARRTASEALLMGRLYDDRGNRMSPSFSAKNGVHYRFYVSSALLRGRKADVGSVGRVPAAEIESTVLTALETHQLLHCRRVASQVSNNTMLKALKEISGDPTLTVHGLRGTFRTWAQDETDFEEEIVEHCMHHITGDDAEKAYKHGQALRKRRIVLQAWADFATKPPAKLIATARAA